MQDIHWYEIAQCEDNPDMINYKTFSDIPEGRVNDSSLVAWVVSGGKLAQIPVEMRTEPVLWSAVRNDSEAYDLILPEDVTDHRSLSLEALRHSKAFFTSVPEAYKDEQFLIDMTSVGSQLINNIRLRDQYDHLLTEYTAKAICTRSISDAFNYCQAGGEKAGVLLKDDYLVEGIQIQTSDYGTLKLMGKEYLLIAMLADGFWPAAQNFNFPPEIHVMRTPPASPTEAVERIQIAKSGGHKILHRCWLQTQPMADVIAELQSSTKGLDELFIIYPERELREYMKLHRSLRGRFVEQDLGM